LYSYKRCKRHPYAPPTIRDQGSRSPE
jgi:hypothetical protein